MKNDTWMYHATEGAKLFDSDALPKESDGWFDSPEKAVTAQEVEPVKRGPGRPRKVIE